MYGNINESTDGFSDVVIFPNPNDGTFYLDLDGFTEPNLQIEVLDISGKTLFIEEVINDNSKRYQINLNYIPKGIYFVKIASLSNTTTRRFIKN